MCLVVKKIKFIFKPKIVYKVLRVNDVGYCTPFYNTFISPHILQGHRRFIASEKRKILKYLKPHAIIESGYIHSIVSKDDAIEFMQNLHKIHPNETYTLHKCIIPSFSLIFIGEHGDVCSRSIRFLEYTKLNEP